MDEATIRTVAVLVNLALSIYVYRDANKRGNAPLSWAVGVFLTTFICLPLYLLIRNALLSPKRMLPVGEPSMCATCGNYSETFDDANPCQLTFRE
jgi:hypothetical protein